MVAITVILAAVIGTFVLGLGDQVSDSSPQVSFNFEATTATVGGGSHTAVQITHDGGDSVDVSDLSVLVDGADAYTDDGGVAGAPFGGSGTLGAGSSTTIVAALNDDAVPDGGDDTYNDNAGTLEINVNGLTTESGVGLSSDQTVRVVWSSSSGGDTATIGKFTIP